MRTFLNRQPGLHYQHIERHNSQWPDHILRSEVTADLITWLGPTSVIDPAAGDASIVAAAHKRHALANLVVGDVSHPNYDGWATMIEADQLPRTTIRMNNSAEITLEQPGTHDVVVLTEFLEHVIDPVAILRLARQRAPWLVASSPLWTSDGEDSNPEHLWQFDEDGYRELLIEGGWTPRLVMPVKFIGEVYDFQVWVAR